MTWSVGMGFLIIYVDDLFGFAVSLILSALFDEIQKLWKLSDPEWIKEDSSTTFCGLEIQALSGGGYRISQYKYLNELFTRYEHSLLRVVTYELLERT